MTPCLDDRSPDDSALERKARELMDVGMTGVIYCGSKGDWPLLSDQQRQEGVRQLVDASVPVIVGTGAQNTALAVAHSEHAAAVGAAGWMVIPRVLSRGASPTAQRQHFAAILGAAPNLPAVIYNSPHYGFETKAVFLDLHHDFPNLVEFKEFGGVESLTYAAEHISHTSDNVLLMAGVDTQVSHCLAFWGRTGS
ncbi:4-hydroxy-tetrahydrodipicolinate synthase [Planctomycetes bacterium CA13]|uniref:4-hydroxy-tetrahydrodipicolinate synthase n=1 Tax=Novipirellula herctigrandis TaxID=2527986 RepID=A0A5C5ZAR0_9BACT|nr:4-hydroxy-tetrahydrodipicolinate synthase [Planctomycetes bacterium CA13]